MWIDAITVGCFAVVGTLVFAVGDLLFGGRRRVLSRNQAASLLQQEQTGALYRGWFSKLLASSVPQLPAEIDGIRRDLSRGGFYSPTALTEYLATRNGLIWLVGLGAAALVWQSQARPDVQRVILMLGWALAISCYGLPRILLRLQANGRVARIQAGLPDALDVTTMCLTGGLPLQDALGRVTQEMQYAHPDIAVELEIVRKQADANTLSHAMRQFANRVDLPDIKSMAALVSQTERLGTNVATAVREFADSLRRGARFRAEERASKASVKLLFPVVLCLAPPVYLLLIGPSVLQLREFLLNENRPGGMLSASMNRGSARGDRYAQGTQLNTATVRSRADAAARVGSPAGAATDAAGSIAIPTSPRSGAITATPPQ
jgi:tight adherence protein C